MESATATAGQLRERVQLHRSTDTIGADGQPVEQTAGPATTLVATRWARLNAVRGTQQNGAQQTVTDVTWQVVMRSDSVTSAIDLGYFLLTDDGSRLDVTWFRDDGVWVEVECVENRAV